MAQLCIRLFGTFQVTIDEVEVSGFASNKVRALLAYLVLEADQPQPREKLAGLLWSDYPEASAAANLRTALANLRSVIGDRAAIPDTAQPHLLITRRTIQFNSESDAWTDAVSFTELAGQGVLAALEQAAGLYRGDFLEGFSLADAPLFEEWALLNRERYRRSVIDALRRLVNGYAERGEHERALPHAWRQLELDPWRETAHQQVMRLLAASGRRAEALVQYETCCRLLAGELGVAPSETTVALDEQIRSGELAAPRQPPARSPARPAQPPVFPTLDGTVGAERPVFVAREAELARLGTHLDLALAGQGSPFFICGEAGSGKTALLAEFARRAMEAHPELVVAGGECSAYSGFGDPYLPFRSILAMLSGDVQTHWSVGIASPGHARRLWEAMPSTFDTLIESGPQVLDVFLRRESLLARASSAVQKGDSWLQSVRERLEQPQTRSERADQSQLFQQTTNVLREVSRVHPLLLIVDDLQWADMASLGLLFHLGRRLRGSQILLLAAFRPEEVETRRGGERHPLQKLVAEFRRDYGDILLELHQAEATGRAFVDALLDTEPNRLGEGFRQVLFQRTSGHPLFTIELLRAMQEGGELFRDESGRWVAVPTLDWHGLPARVEGVIEERLGRLDEGQREILRMASIEGERFTAQVIARMAKAEEHKLLRDLSRELEGRQRLVRWLSVLRVGKRRLLRYRFSHALFQQYLYASISPGERQLLHGEIAAILEDLYRGDQAVVVPQLARHYFKAGDEERALRYLTLAADTALADYASDEADTNYRRALELAQDGAQQAQLLEGLGRALAQQSRFTEALQAWREAIEIARPLGDLEGMARLYACSSSAAWWSGDLARQQRLAEEGLEATAGAAESADRAHLLHEAARAYWFNGSPGKAESLCRDALALAEKSGAIGVQADALTTLGSLPGQRPQDAVALLARAAELAEDANLLHIAFRAHNNLALMIGVVNGSEAAYGEVQRAAELGRQTGNVIQEIFALNNLLEISLTLGEMERAQAHLSRVRQLASELDDPESVSERIRRLEATVLLYQGQWTQAASLLRICQADARERKTLDALWNVDLLLARALLEAATLGPGSAHPELDQAEHALREGVEIGAKMAEAGANTWFCSYLVSVYVSQGQMERAGEMLDQAQAAAKDYPYPPVEMALLWAKAQLAVAEQRWTDALTSFELLAETCVRCGIRWDRARSLIDWAAAHTARGDEADLNSARSLLQESEAEFQEMGIPRYAELARERLRALPAET